MSIAIIGANGMVGSRVVAEAISQGYEVDAYTRGGTAPEGAVAHKLNLSDTAEVIEVINSHDFTLISSGGRDNQAAIAQAHTDLIKAEPSGRFMVVGGAGALNAGKGRLYDLPDFPEIYLSEAKLFGGIFDDYIAHASGLNWSMIAPAPEIAPGTRTGDYTEERDIPAGNFISAEDFAVAIVDEFKNKNHIGERFTVASADEQAATA